MTSKKLSSNKEIISRFISLNCYFGSAYKERREMNFKLNSYVYFDYLESMKDIFEENNDIEENNEIEIKNTDYDPRDLAWWYISDSPALCQDMSSSMVENWAIRLTTYFGKDEYKSLLLAIKEEIILLARKMRSLEE